jgi:hypothetical protein
VVTQQSLKRYHIFNSFRPWIFSQWYLAEEVRPVDMTRTIQLLAVIGFGGLVLMRLGGFLQRRICTHLPSPLPAFRSAEPAAYNAGFSIGKVSPPPFAPAQIVT